MNLKPLLVTAVLVGVLAPVAEAQLCIGQPFKSVFVSGWRDKDATLTGRVGIRPSAMTSLTANYAMPKAPENGSKLFSYGGRLTYGGDRGSWGMCALVGVQRGYAYLLNAEGIRHNARISSVTIPIGLGFGQSIPLGGKGKVRLILSTLPQVLLRNNNLILYSRADTASVGTTATDYGVSVASDLQVGPLRVGASVFRSRDLPWTWSIGAGVGR